MSDEGQLIICRKCKETIVMDEGTCHHCGTNVRGDIPYIAAILFGLSLVVITPFNPSELLFFGIFGLIVVILAGYLFYEKRQRIKMANER